MCAKPIVDALSDKVGFARLFAVSSFFGALGGLLYALAGQKALTGGAHVGVGALLVARMLGGFAGAMSTLGNAYIVRTTPDAAQRGQQLALIAAATLVGVFVGPAVVPLFAKVHDVKVGILTIDELNLPGFFLFTIFSLLLVVQPFILREPAPLSAEVASPPGRPQLDNGTPASPGSAPYAEEAASSRPPGGGRPGAFTLFLSYTSTWVFACVMFSTTPVVPVLTERYFGWGPVPNSYLFLSVAMFTLVGVVTTGNLLKAGWTHVPIQLVAVMLLLYHELYVFLYAEYIFANPFKFIFWVGVAATAYAGLSGSNAAAVTAAVNSRSAGFYIGLLGFIDTFGMSMGPLYLKMFRVDRGAQAGQAIALSRGVIAIPTALLFVLHAIRFCRALGTGGLRPRLVLY